MSDETTISRQAADIAAVRLPTPDRVEWGRVLWIYAIPIALLHALALLAALPWLFSWTGLIVCLVGVHLFGQAINIGYHRLLTHRSFVTPWWMERLIVLVALCCMQDTPGRWVATHRYHHKHSDEQEDPHSPLVNFIWAHFGWLMVHNASTHSIAVYQKYARDVLEDRWFMKLEKKPLLPLFIYLGHAALFMLAGGAIGYAMAGTAAEAVRMALSLLVWGVIVRTVIVWHITWSVNSLTHLFGYRNYEDTGDNSRNNWLVALITVGEGWHNNHHHDAAAASVQHRWWEIDISYYEIRLLEMVGLAKKVIRPRHQRLAERAAARAEAAGEAVPQASSRTNSDIGSTA